MFLILVFLVKLRFKNVFQPKVQKNQLVELVFITYEALTTTLKRIFLILIMIYLIKKKIILNNL